MTGHVTGPDKRPPAVLWVEDVTSWLEFMKAVAFSKYTIERRRTDVCLCSHDVAPLGPTEVTPEVLVAWMAGKEWVRDRRRAVIASVKSFFAWEVKAGRISESPVDVLPKVRASLPNPKPVPDDVFIEALRGADERTRLMLRLAGEGGLRRQEIAQVKSDDVVEGGWLSVFGKGEKPRLVPLPEDLAGVITAAHGWLFPNKHGGHLSVQHVGKLGEAALPGRWTLHKLRHRFATTVYRGTDDLLATQQLLGHSSPATTQRYVLVAPERLRQAARFAVVMF